MNDHQIDVPTSFQDLFRSRPGARLNEPWHHVLARYEVCEDLAQMLLPQARAFQADLGVTPADVVTKMASALAHPAVGLATEELDWVRTRLIELMENF